METKTCKRCGAELSVSLFHKCSQSDDGYYHVCKECRKAAADKCKARAKIKPLDPALSEFTDTQLFDELKARGWEGKIYKEVTAVKSMH